MIDPTDKILTALYTLLNNQVSVTPITGTGSVNVPFYTFPPNQATYPYITVSQVNLNSDTDKISNATTITVILDVVTYYEGDGASAKQANEIADGILSLLDKDNKLTLSGVTNWRVEVLGSNLLNEMTQSGRIVRKLMTFELGVWA